ncbi:AAA family ATPase [Neotabrizicola shimadae]|uniref:AAA family ATPase n=1 Tax=Neotabrizicola shimadae TaxID=2807096 RepID=A0A8G0ZQL7_9RHOB|nr:ATP-binding protein [Neotabrizicola shimadae]QYZ68298.1 AAA family ATPase [Neotabrizicola shimadae]
MRLVSVTLANVRRFTDPVQILGVGPGLNVLSAANEQGKSTLFDALHAVFFLPHRAKGKEIKALRPHSGGNPEVTVEIDLPEGRHRITKRWMGRETATVHRDGQLVAQADAAEDFIARLMTADSDAGPAGLLWVRQGLTRLEDDAGTATEREKARANRRGLMTSVAGEVDELTGGRRMDRALHRCREDLAQYLTASGRPLKGGPLALAEAAVEDLTARKAELDSTARTLADGIARRLDLRRTLAELTEPEAAAARKARLDEARARHEAAERHAGALEQADARLRAADLAQRNATDRLAALNRARTEADAAARAAAQARAAASAARIAREEAEAALAPLATGLAEARKARQEAEALHHRATAAALVKANAHRRAELQSRLDTARALLADRTALARAAATGPDAKALAEMEKLAQALDIQRGLRDRSAPHLHFRHDGPARVQQNGQPLAADAILAVTEPATFDLPGLGQLTVTPGSSTSGAGLDKAASDLAAALSRLGQPDLDTARAAATARATAQAALSDLDSRLKLLAPDGLARLEADLAALPAAAADPADLPDPATAAAALKSATDRLTQAEAAAEAARTRLDHLREADTRAAVLADAAATAEAKARAALAVDSPEAEAALLADLATARQSRDAALAERDSLAAAAPDRAAVAAALARATSVATGAEDDIRKAELELARLDSEIALRSGEGVLEDLADTAARLQAAEARLAATRTEVEVLKELAAALEAARNEARDRYLEPVMAELRPLLRALWPDAELHFDGESLLPTRLVRGGTEEDLDVLSGGTQEQVALLVRLAFARLLAKRGRPAPVILDDALIFTDDDRIEKMFDALTALAADQQILVLTCRQRAFRDLGGTRLALSPP